MTEDRIVIAADLAGERADKILSQALGISRSRARSAFDSGGVTCEGAPVRPSDRMDEGRTLMVVLPDRGVALTPDAAVPFDVVFEDADILVIDKPIGVVVHPTSDRSTGTLVHGLLERYPDLEGVGVEGRWGIVHRLDRDTSGLLVVARTRRAYEQLTAMMRARRVARRYLTMVVGEFDGTLGTIEAPIRRDPRNPTRMRLDHAGRPAITHYRRLAGWHTSDASLLSVELETGRTHQIRVHMQAIDHPIIGDPAYGRTGSPWDPGRPWLHARQLTFTHPASETPMNVVSALPRDLRDSLAAIGPPDVGDVADIDGTPL